MFNLVARSPTRCGHVADLMTPDVRASFSPWPLLFLLLPIDVIKRAPVITGALFIWLTLRDQ
jgi:hypothetical protein